LQTAPPPASAPSHCQLYDLPNLHLLSHTPQQPPEIKIGDGEQFKTYDVITAVFFA